MISIFFSLGLCRDCAKRLNCSYVHVCLGKDLHGSGECDADVPITDSHNSMVPLPVWWPGNGAWHYSCSLIFPNEGQLLQSQLNMSLYIVKVVGLFKC